jgi:hypothetical protein
MYSGERDSIEWSTNRIKEEKTAKDGPSRGVVRRLQI